MNDAQELLIANTLIEQLAESCPLALDMNMLSQGVRSSGARSAKPADLARIIGTLETRGWVERVPNPFNRRIVNYRLTSSGLDYAQENYLDHGTQK